MLKSELKHDEPMDTSETYYEGYEEEGEIHSSDDEEVCWTGKKKEGPGVDSEPISHGFTLDEAEEMKRLQRAKRFALPVEESDTVPVNSDSVSRLYKSLGIEKKSEKHYRLNAIHMRGTQHMSTKDVFEYFTLFTPSYVEWINDVSCNVVWMDNVSTAKALLKLSKEIKNLDKIRFNTDPFNKDFKEKIEKMDFNSEGDAVDAREIDVAIPPGFWRIGVPTTKSQAILLRFATRSDKKQKNAEKNSEYYKKYGNPHFGNLRGIVSSSLRSEVFKRNKKPQDNNELEDKNERKNPWGHLAEEWSKVDDVKDVRSRISLKRQKPSLNEDLRLSINSKHKRLKRQKQSDCESSESESDNYDKGKFPKMRMYADEEEKIENNSRRSRISSQLKVPFVEDLRLKIDRSRKKKEMLEQGYKHKRYWNKYDLKKEVDEYYDEDDDNDNNGNNDKNDVDDYGDDDEDEGEDEDEDDEEKGSTWALEQYSDLRESLEQSKKCRISNYNKKVGKSDSEDKDDGSDDIYNGDFNHRSPLQIEFENDEYFENDSV